MSGWLDNQNLLQVFDWTQVFGNNHPVHMELGAGDGGFILAYAQQHPQINFIAVERLLGRARKIAKRSEQRELANVRTLRLESNYVIRWMTPQHSLDCVHIMFPDPWPKRKHFKYRLIQADFLNSLDHALKPQGEVRFSTDHADYFRWSHKVFSQDARWHEEKLWDYSTDPLTDFQKGFEQEGRITHRMRWSKV